MRFVVNATALRFGGGLTVGHEVVRRLGALAPHHEFLVLVSANCGYEQFARPNMSVTAVEWPNMGVLRRLTWLNRGLPQVCKTFRAHALFSMGNMPSYCAGLPQVVLFHKPHYVYPEVVPVLSPGLGDRLVHQLEKMYIRLALGNSWVTVQTEVIRERFVKNFRFPRERIDVIPSAASLVSKTDGDAGPYREAIRFFKKELRLIYLTHYYPHKNIEILLEVAELIKMRGIADIVIFLTLDEGEGAAVLKLLEEIRRRRLDDVIVNLGSIPREYVFPTLARCHALVMPTLLETFGLPYLEALGAGCHVLTSDRDFSRAVCGDSADYFDPLDPNDILNKILQFKDRWKLDGGHRVRNLSFDTGIARISWDEVTLRYLHLLERAASDSRVRIT